ncbi:MAG: ATP-binding protein [Hyphomicrobium sp.]
MSGKKSKRSISDQEISLIKAMLGRDIDKTTIQAYFTHPDRPVNYGRITNIDQGSYGPTVAAATDAELDSFLETWRSKRDPEANDIAADVVDLSALSPVDARRLQALFERDENGQVVLLSGESDEVEIKQSFHRPLHDRFLRAVAALANNRGGYVLFGVDDSTGCLTGLNDQRFKSADPSEFAMAIRSAMEPCPRFEIGTAEIGGAQLGAVYVHRETDGPVIAIKDEQTFKAGVVYFRYPGESRAISGADFRRLLALRDRRARQEAAELAKRAVELGGDGALLDFQTGQIEGRSGSLFISPELLQKMQFIREGEFVQKDGAAALRLVGDVSVAATPADTLIRERIVRQAITDRDVLGNFLDQQQVQFPAEYILHSCHSNKRWLPLFFFARMVKRPIEEIIDLVRSEEGATAAVRGRLIDRLAGRASARVQPSTISKQIIASIQDGSITPAKTLSDVRRQAVAIQVWADATVPIEKPVAILKDLRAKVRELSNDIDRSTEIRRAAAWLDELYYKDLMTISTKRGESK